jgi:hypothetical protein
MKRAVLIGAAALTLCGCASIWKGTSQEMVINTNPAGADCAINRNGETIGRVNPTPGQATIKKTKYAIDIACDKAGYQQATYFDKSGIESATWGNFIFGGLVGWGIDSASGADNHYESPINITLVPAASTPPRGGMTPPGSSPPMRGPGS